MVSVQLTNFRQEMLNMFEHEFNEDNHADCDVFSVEHSRFLKMMGRFRHKNWRSPSTASSMEEEIYHYPTTIQ